MPHPYWPLFDLEVRTPRLTLRYIDDQLAIDLASLAGRGIHDPSWMPFLHPWTDVSSPELERNAFRFWWGRRAATRPDAWSIECAVIVAGELRGELDGAPAGTVIGACGLMAEQFGVLRSIETGSWLGQEFQGHGLGRELRVAALHLAFAGLEAEFATTGAFSDNGPSLGVTRSLGYEHVGTRRVVRRGEPADLLGYRLPRSHWETIRRNDIEIIGLEGVRDLLGLTPAT